MTSPVIMTATAAAVDDINAIFEALDYGENAISAACISADAIDPSPETPATHYINMDRSATEAKLLTWRAMAQGTLPTLPNGVEWGVNGVISEQAAQAALTLGNLRVACEDGNASSQDEDEFLAGVLAGKNLIRRPEGGAWG